jgi:hypothetical protein
MDRSLEVFHQNEAPRLTNRALLVAGGEQEDVRPLFASAGSGQIASAACPKR